MKNPCLDCHKNTAPLSGGGATIGTGMFASRVRRQERSTEWDAGAGRIVENSNVVFRSNDLWLRRSRSQSNAKTLYE